MIEQPVLPQLFCPFPAAVNPHVDVVGQRTMAWARQFALLPDEAGYQRLEATRLGWLAARTHPQIPVEELQLVADWCTWLFVRDDHCDEAGIGRCPERFQALHERLLQIVTTASTSSNDPPLVHALGNLVERTRSRASQEWMARFTDQITRFFDAGAWEANNRVKGITPEVQQYIKMRPFTSGMYAFIVLSELAEHINLPPIVRNHPSIVRLNELATIVACWMNDLISFGKELKQGDVHNLVLTLRHQYKLTLQEAVDRAAALHDAQVRAFIDLEQRLPHFDSTIDAEVNRYRTVLRFHLRGNLDWSYRTGRYLMLAVVNG